MFLLLFINLLFTPQDSFYVRGQEYIGFHNAVSVTSDGKGFIYVLDNEKCEIVKFDENLKVIKRAGRKGWDNGEFDNPAYIDGSSGLDIYVSDYNNSRVQRFDLNLGFISSLNTNSEIIEDKFKINRPSASIILNTQDLYVLDRDNPKIVLFSQGVTPTIYFGSYQSLEGALIKPSKILKDSKNIIYVFDKAKGVLKFDNFGTYLGNLNIDSVVSISIYNNILCILTPDELIFYDCNAAAFINTLAILGKNENITYEDLLIYNSQKFFILQNKKIFSFIKK